MRAASLYKTLVIPAGLARAVAVTGSAFYLESATGEVDAQFDEGATLRMKAGQSLELPPGDLYTKILFTNPDTSSTLTITYYAGTLRVGTFAHIVYSRPARTYLVGSNYTVTSAADETIDSTNLRNGKTKPDSRSHCIITNLSGDTGCYVKDAAGTTCGYVQFLTSWQITTPDTLALRSQGASMTIAVANFFNYES